MEDEKCPLHRSKVVGWSGVKEPNVLVQCYPRQHVKKRLKFDLYQPQIELLDATNLIATN